MGRLFAIFLICRVCYRCVVSFELESHRFNYRNLLNFWINLYGFNGKSENSLSPIVSCVRLIESDKRKYSIYESAQLIQVETMGNHKFYGKSNCNDVEKIQLLCSIARHVLHYSSAILTLGNILFPYTQPQSTIITMTNQYNMIRIIPCEQKISYLLNYNNRR